MVLAYLTFSSPMTLSCLVLPRKDKVKNILDMFCEESGQLVSAHKSKIFVSPNIPDREARMLSHISGFTLTKDLGMYLGVPLIHTKFSKRNYQYIIERLSKKLAGWKADSLNLMGRATLVQSVTSTIPNYTMQTTALPVSITNQIDRINRNFLWGDKDDKKKVHLVNWNMFANPRSVGGLVLGKLVFLTWPFYRNWVGESLPRKSLCGSKSLNTSISRCTSLRIGLPTRKPPKLGGVS